MEVFDLEKNKQLINEKPDFINFCTARSIQQLRNFLVGINWQPHPLIDNCNIYFEEEHRGEHLEYSIINKSQMIHQEMQTAEEKTEIEKNLILMKNPKLLKLFDDLTVDILDIICHLWIIRADKSEDYIEATADDFLFIRGLDKKNNGNGGKSGYQKAQRNEIKNRLGLLSKIQYYWAFRNKKKLKGYLIAAEKQDKNFYYKIYVGDLLKNFLKKPNLQYGQYPQSILQLNYKKDFWSKRIGRYVYWRTRISKGEVPYTKMLHIVGSVNPKYCSSIKRYRLNLLVDNAFMKLESTEILKKIEYQHSEHYIDIPDGDYDDILEEYYENISDKTNGLAYFLDKSLVRFEPSEYILDNYKKIETRVKKYIPSKIEKNKKFRCHVVDILNYYSKEQKCSINSIAKDINISRKTLGLYKNGKHLPTRKNADKIYKYLEEKGEHLLIIPIDLD